MPDNKRTVQHDGMVAVSLGKSRNDKRWQNKELLWSQLVDRLSGTHYTSETHEEYMKATKTRQNEIKDVGGFVGGHLVGGRRLKRNILSRTLLTLDADYITDLEKFMDVLEFGFADISFVLYSTHKHTPAHPRLRLVIPLSREVDAHEYEALGRGVAHAIGIEYFDDTTYQPERLMYFPSTSKGSSFFFRFQDRGFMKVDEILRGTYGPGDRWKDSSQWPVSSRQKEIIKRVLKKQEDPLQKGGVIGAFCRSFTIQEVIETYLGGIYEPADNDNNRYTYKAGSTAGGLVIYADKFAYSHHGTDPVSGMLCNAFDLVRIHKFGDKDDNVSLRTPIGKRPSFKAMEDFVTSIDAVKSLLIKEKTENAVHDFAGIEIEVNEEADAEWMKELKIDKRGNVLNGLDNIVTILLNDSQLKGSLIFEEFSQREKVIRDLPWRKTRPEDENLKDEDVSNLKHFLKVKYDMNATTVSLEDSLNVVFQKNRKNELKNYLNGIEWDGEPRIDTYLIKYLGAADTRYTRAVSRKTLVAAVARVFQPGIKFDYMLTLIGDQGIGKSTLVKKLGGKWFTDSFNFDLLKQGNKAYEQLQGSWIIESGELQGLRKAEVEAAKSFLTSREDRYRVAYGRRVSFFPRKCIFIGTTNNMIFLRDQTGNRRFWVVVCFVEEAGLSVFDELTRDVVDQLWAEAVTVFKAGKERLYLDRELEEYANALRSSHTEVDDRVDAISDYLERLLPVNWEDMGLGERRQFLAKGEDSFTGPGVIQRTRVCAAEIWCELFESERSKMNAYNTKFIHEALAKIGGWEKKAFRFPIYGVQKGYEKDVDHDQKHRIDGQHQKTKNVDHVNQNVDDVPF